MSVGQLTVGLVGVCGSGKTTLSNNLSAHPYTIRHIAQEHSYVPDMWQRLVNPDVLIFLEVSYPVSLQRKPFNWREKEYQTQLHRLRHANENADLHIDTDRLSPEQVCQIALSYLVEFSN